MLALSNAYDTVLSKNVAHLLDIKRPTVHHALEVLQEKGLIRKELYGDVRLAEIAATLGFCDEFHLSKAFKRKYGAPPSQYRRRNDQ